MVCLLIVSQPLQETEVKPRANNVDPNVLFLSWVKASMTNGVPPPFKALQVSVPVPPMNKMFSQTFPVQCGKYVTEPIDPANVQQVDAEQVQNLVASGQVTTKPTFLLVIAVWKSGTSIEL